MEITTPRPRKHSLEDYFELERTSAIRHEFHDGEIVAMSSGSIMHGTICTNVVGEVRSRLQGRPCRSFTGDTRVKVKRLGRFYYPDASALCGPVEIDHQGGLESIANPQLVVEVMSPSTERADRTTKFDAYRQIESLLEYVLVEQDEARANVFSRNADGGWRFATFVGVEANLVLTSIGIEIPLRGIYQDVEFPLPVPDGSVGE